MTIVRQSIPRQIFIVGMNGSGTTMLLDHLSSHTCIYGFAAETRSLPYFIASEGKYGDLSDDENFAALWRDMVDAIIGPMRSTDVARDVPVLQRRDPASVFDFVLGSLAKKSGKAIWCEKTPMHVRHISLLSAKFPNAKFIHIVRDGRDCAASFHRRWGFSPLRTIARWKHSVAEGIRQGRALDEGRYLEVSYEQITADPEPTLRTVLSFLGLPFEPAVLGSARKRPNTTAPSHGRVVRNARNAESYFSPSQIALMEGIAGQLLSELGYQCANPHGNRELGRVEKRRLELTDDVRRLVTLSLRHGRVFRPSKWGYLIGHVRNAMKQKSTS
jgi:hypothetical protein